MFILVNHTTKDRSYEQLYLCESSGYDCKCYKISVLFSVIYLLVRMIVMMEYLNMDTFFNMPDADMKLMLEDAAESPPDT